MDALAEKVIDLIRSGDIHRGMIRAAVMKRLGEPDAIGGTSRKYRVPSVFKYGVVQFVYHSCRTQQAAEVDGLLYAYIDDEPGHEYTYLLPPSD